MIMNASKVFCDQHKNIHHQYYVTKLLTTHHEKQEDTQVVEHSRACGIKLTMILQKIAIKTLEGWKMPLEVM